MWQRVLQGIDGWRPRLQPSQYAAGTDKIEILLPEIPAVLQPFLKGTINAQVTGKKADGTPVACLEVNLELA